MKFSIRRVDGSNPEWALVLRALQKACLPSDTLFATKAGWWFIAFNELSEPVAFAGMVPSARWSDCVYFCRAGVLPAFQGRGLQKRLIRARLRTAKALGMNWAVSDTYDNPASANSLIATGFKMFEPTVPWGARRTLYWRHRIKHAL
jgi:GNAT superfamily N-acetyltransferase